MCKPHRGGGGIAAAAAAAAFDFADTDDGRLRLLLLVGATIAALLLLLLLLLLPLGRTDSLAPAEPAPLSWASAAAAEEDGGTPPLAEGDEAPADTPSPIELLVDDVGALTAMGSNAT